MIPIDVKKIAAVAGLCLLVASIVFWYCFGSGRVQDYGSGADQVRTDIQSAINEQSSAIERLGTIEAGLDDSAAKAGELSTRIGAVADAIADVESRISEGEERTRTSQQLIEEGQRILEQIRARGASGD